MFKIGNKIVLGKVGLAPMAGVSNPAFLKIAEEMGASFAITELLSAEAIIRDNKKTIDMLVGFDKISMPVGIQLFGSNPDVMGRAAKIICSLYNPQFIDINMGCPVPKVAVRSGAGSALMRDPELAYEIVKAVVDSVNIPVSVKIRSGWDSNSINAVHVAKICEKAGASFITVHGRTRSQGYTGSVDLNIIKEVKENVNIPVIGNGDIIDYKSADEMLSYTGCDAIMIGRGALGNPFLIREVDAYLNSGDVISKPSFEEKINMCIKHMEYLINIKPEKVAILEMRSHASWYIKSLPGAQRVKKDIFKANTYEDMKNILNNYLKELKNGI